MSYFYFNCGQVCWVGFVNIIAQELSASWGRLKSSLDQVVLAVVGLS